jgi:integrase
MLRTSQQKQKGIDDDDVVRVCHATLATRSPHAKYLADALLAGSLTGARLVEWPIATFRESSVPGFAWELMLVNGKQGNGRAHGETRTLRWRTLPDHFASSMQRWISVAAEAAAEERYEKLIETLEALMRRVTNALFARRRRRPTLSSTRHAAAARWKQTYVAGATSEEEKLLGLAMVAALMGHASDETATTHYARARGGKSVFPVPTPDPAEVARVRQRYSMIAKRSKPEPQP